MTKKKTHRPVVGGKPLDSTLTIPGRNSQRGDGTVVRKEGRYHLSATTGPRQDNPAWRCSM